MCDDFSISVCPSRLDKLPVDTTPKSTKSLGRLRRQIGTSELRAVDILIETTAFVASGSIESGYTSDEDKKRDHPSSKLGGIYTKSHSTSELEICDSENNIFSNKETLFSSPQLEVNYHLKTLPTNCSTAYRRIEAETLCELMTSTDEAQFCDKYIVVDCRYDFEYQGGHIKNAINVYNPDDLREIFFDSDGCQKMTKIPIFHCEFSQKRGPAMASALRELDRKYNAFNYPNCCYSEMYVLNGGYKNFYNYTKSNQKSKDFCEPESYIAMINSKYAEELKKHEQHKKVYRKNGLKNSKSTGSLDFENRFPFSSRLNSFRSLSNHF